ncbi:MAG: C-GCAxxG-C-C family protein [Candidatus Hodarchaeales archaeon]
MKDEKNFDEILSNAYTRMHRYTCAEASLQALLDLWGLDIEKNSWATAGYLGAITSGNTTCGLLIGCSIAIGLKYGKDLTGTPEENEFARDKASQAVNELFTEFIEKFGSTNCKTLNKVDFREGKEISDWITQRGWKNTCDVFLGYVLTKCHEMSQEDKF